MPDFHTLEKPSLSKAITEVSLEQHQAQAIRIFYHSNILIPNLFIEKIRKNDWCDKLEALDATFGFLQKF